MVDNDTSCALFGLLSKANQSRQWLLLSGIGDLLFHNRKWEHIAMAGATSSSQAKIQCHDGYFARENSEIFQIQHVVGLFF
jgi:hypothetical protein